MFYLATLMGQHPRGAVLHQAMSAPADAALPAGRVGRAEGGGVHRENSASPKAAVLAAVQMDFSVHDGVAFHLPASIAG
ncbi:hypothetical protein [Phenylobacterium sp.]|uniref:hypothetical protein n=1 Tax=Phenylobacterium sp. TaxID=1871053 RepID=UPI0035B1D3E0